MERLEISAAAGPHQHSRGISFLDTENPGVGADRSQEGDVGR